MNLDEAIVLGESLTVFLDPPLRLRFTHDVFLRDFDHFGQVNAEAICFGSLIRLRWDIGRVRQSCFT